MAIVQCKNHHYYDDSKNQECPYCKKMENLEDVNELGEQLTSYKEDAFDFQEEQLTEGYGDFVEEYEKTIGIFMDETKNTLTAGWLVCMHGLEKGKSYMIHSGRNFIGRSVDMDIVLSEDYKISEQKHFSIVYDPKSISFYFVAGNGQVYINERAVNEECLLKDGDLLSVGDSKYMFVPFCKEGRVWE